ncbi:hypothetical protein TanjilG_16989 [Lupinus angustifolius]|nr:hypothetical protein TanjilG_16989 [Lupinus angustifolius]
MGPSCDFTVSLINEEVVTSVLPMQERWLPLSNLDLLLPPLNVGVFFCYKNCTKTNFGSMVRSLKKGLAQALVSYYALAGEVVVNSIGEPELLCNNRGVNFVEAVADIELQCLNFYNPDHTFQGKLVPEKKHGVLAVQATWLKCGGVVVACTFDHRIADAYSANMFLVSWAEMARPIKPASTLNSPPCFRRSLLSPRRRSIHPSIDNMYIPISNISPPPSITTDATVILSRIYYVMAEDLHFMQSLATNNGTAKRTKLESFSAFLWKMVARAASIEKNGKRVIAKMGIVVDGRKCLSLSNCGDNKGKNELMGCYFGNVLSIPFGEKPVDELVEKPLWWVADEVHEFLATAATEEHFLGLIDWVEAHRPVPGLARIYCGGSDEGPTFVVSSGQRFPQEKVDFGWGKAVFGSYHFPWDGEAGYVMPMPSPVRNGDWVVYMHLEEGLLEIIECEAAHDLV